MSFKLLIFLALFHTGISQIVAQELFSFEEPTLNGGSYSFAECKGKKTMFVVLATDVKDSMHQHLIDFAQKQNAKIRIFGLIGLDNKSTNEEHQALFKMYSQSEIVLLQPSMLSKVQNDKQVPLIRWLTHKELNHHFDKDALEPQTRFFIDETGRLYSVLSRHAGWDTPFIQRVLDAKPPKTSL